jgi:hypothetical protein
MRIGEKTKGDGSYAALVGFDWADQEHVWVLQWSDTGERERGRLEQTPEALETGLSQLMTRLDGRRIAAIEQKHGAVVWMLLKYECIEIYPIHPQAAGQFRQALYPSGSKSDPADGELLLELLVHHRHRLHVLEHEDDAFWFHKRCQAGLGPEIGEQLVKVSRMYSLCAVMLLECILVVLCIHDDCSRVTA